MGGTEENIQVHIFHRSLLTSKALAWRGKKGEINLCLCLCWSWAIAQWSAQASSAQGQQSWEASWYKPAGSGTCLIERFLISRFCLCLSACSFWLRCRVFCALAALECSGFSLGRQEFTSWKYHWAQVNNPCRNASGVYCIKMQNSTSRRFWNWILLIPKEFK